MPRCARGLRAAGGISAGGDLRGNCCCCCYCYFYYYYFSPFPRAGRRRAPGMGGTHRGQEGDARPPSHSGTEKVEGRDLGRWRRRRGGTGPAGVRGHGGLGGHGGNGVPAPGQVPPLRPLRAPVPLEAGIRFPCVFRGCLLPRELSPLSPGSVRPLCRAAGGLNRRARSANFTAAEEKENRGQGLRAGAATGTGTRRVCPTTVSRVRPVPGRWVTSMASESLDLREK